MKKIYAFWIISFLFFSVNFSFANIPTVRQQLEKLNKYWITSDCSNTALSECKFLPTDVELIQMHLTLVEQHLRNKKLNLTTVQKANRLRILDTLHMYMQRGVFPKNLYHRERTPYFIDDFGTACAVGQLIISSGYESFAKRISKENNYAYIESMDYSELFAWANKFGFEVDELKWIQPAYCYVGCEPNTYKNVSCYGGYDGCVGRPTTPTISDPPYTYKFYFSQNEQWYNFDSIMSMSLPGCDLSAGRYKWVAINSLNNTEDFVFTLTQPDSIFTSITVTDDNGSCNGEVALDISGGSPPYNYFLVGNNDSIFETTELCQGEYTVVVKDSNLCSRQYSIEVKSSAGVSNNQLSNISISPNPSHGKFTLFSNISQGGMIDIYSITGAKIETHNYTSLKQVTVDISTQPKGTYLVKVHNTENVWTQRVIIE